MKRRRLASITAAIAHLAPAPIMTGTWCPAHGAWNDGCPPAPPPAAAFEVVREHPATGRSQLAGWGIATQAEADALAARLNARAEAAGGRTLAMSGLLESGWHHRAREASR